jgi:hypothetical protein
VIPRIVSHDLNASSHMHSVRLSFRNQQTPREYSFLNERNTSKGAASEPVVDEVVVAKGQHSLACDHKKNRAERKKGKIAIQHYFCNYWTYIVLLWGSGMKVY